MSAEQSAELTPRAAAETLLMLRGMAVWDRLGSPVAEMGKEKKRMEGYVIPKLSKRSETPMGEDRVKEKGVK